MKYFLLLLLLIAPGCATKLKNASIAEIKQHQTSGVAAFVLTEESLRDDFSTIGILSPEKSYEIKTDGVATLELRDAKVFMVELPVGVYRFETVSYNGRMYKVLPEVAARSQFQVTSENITPLPALNVVKGEWRNIENDQVATALIDAEVKEALRTTFPERAILAPQLLQRPRNVHLINREN